MSQEPASAEPVETFAVTATAESPTRTHVQTREFDFVVDEPPALGGENAGPNPVEYLLGAWAGCLNVVCHLVADEQGIELDDLEIDIQGDIDLRRVLGHAAETRAGYRSITADVVVETHATDQALEEWIETVERRCPVLDNLADPTPVETTVTRRGNGTE